MDGPIVRVALVVVLLAMLVGQLFWFGANPPESPARSLSGTTLDEDYDPLVGQRVVVEGTVVSTTPVVLAIDRDDTNVRLTVRGLDGRVSVGDHLRVHGVLERGHELRALDGIAIPSWGRPYTYAVSSLASLWVLTRLVRHWRVDAAHLALEPRRGATSVDDDG